MRDDSKVAEDRLLLGVGIYSTGRAARLARVHPSAVRRWLAGYTYLTEVGRRVSPPVWRGDLPMLEGRTALSFLDLVELRFVAWFRKKGVTWSTLRRAEELGAELVGHSHPFSTRRFQTDGHAIFARLAHERPEQAILDLTRGQVAFRAIIEPYLFEELDFSSDDRAERWWPLGKSEPVLIDPRRSFGKPIVDREGVPTRVLASAYRSIGSYAGVSRWFDVRRDAVRAAVHFEQRLAA